LAHPSPHAAVSRVRYYELLILLGALQAFAPLSIDMYLPSLPTLETVFHSTPAAVQSTMVTYFIGFALGQTLYGPLTDRFGRKPPIYAGIVVFVLSCVGSAFAPSIAVMAIFRLFQAVGACSGGVISRAMVRDMFEPQELRKIFSILILVLGVSPMVAPILGSYLLEWFSWRAIFLAQAALGTACLVAMFFRLPESMKPGTQIPLRFDTVVGNYRRLFEDRTFIGASLVCGFSSSGMFAYIATSPFVFQNLYHMAPRTFSWIFALNAMGYVGAAQVNGRLRHVPIWRVLRVAAMVQLFAGVLLLGVVLMRLGGTGIAGAVALIVPIFLYLCAAGFVFPSGSAIAMTRHPQIAGSASALLGTLQFIVAAISTTLLGYIELKSALPMGVVMAGCGLCATLLNLTVLGSRLEAGPVARVKAAREEAAH
jgi:DHA1 family bicyclomycin/chloramphenicol resistance-like MFS transporter